MFFSGVSTVGSQTHMICRQANPQHQKRPKHPRPRRPRPLCPPPGPQHSLVAEAERVGPQQETPKRSGKGRERKRIAATFTKVYCRARIGSTRRVKTLMNSCYHVVLRQVHPETGISNKGMAVLNSFVNDLFERIANEASSE